MNIRLFALVVGGVSIVCFAAHAVEETPSAAAASQQAQKVQVEDKELQGQISAISSNFVAVLLDNNADTGVAQEAAFNLAKNVRVIHKNSLKDLKTGDTVMVSYSLTKEKLDDGRISQKKAVKSITFLKAAPKGLVGQESATAAPKESVGVSQAAQPLSLKGLKGEAGNE